MSAEYLKRLPDEELLSYFQHPKPVKVCLPEHESWIIRQLKRTPLLGKLIQNAHASGRSVYNLNQLSGAFMSTSRSSSNLLGQVTRFSSLGVALYNFLFIPFYYLGSWLFTGDANVTAGSNGKWILGGILLAHAILALIMPPLAISLAISASAITLGASVITVGYNIYLAANRYQKMKNLESENTRLQDHYEREIIPLINQFIKEQSEDNKKNLLDAYIKWHAAMQKNVNEKHLQQEDLKKLRTEDIPDKAVSVLLAAMILAGMVVCVWFPIAGAAILAGSAILGLTYVGVRCTYALGKTAYQQTRKHVIPEQPAFESTYGRLNRKNPGFLTMQRIVPESPSRGVRRRRPSIIPQQKSPDPQAGASDGTTSSPHQPFSSPQW